MGLVLANAQTAQTLSANNAFKSYKFTALKATAASVSLVGFEDAGFTFTLRGITVEVNSGSPLLLGLKPTIDWAGSFASTGGYLVETGDPDHPMLIDFRGTPLVGFAAEHVVLQIADNVFVSGAFSFRMGEVETVDVVKSGPDIAGLQVKTIKVGAQGVSIFLGDGLASYDIDDDIATYMSDQHPAMVVTGETVGNLVDGKIYRLVGSTLSAPNLTPGGGAGQNYSDTTVWRPVAATYLAGDSPGSVAVGETVGVWDATTVTYRVFERTTSVFTLAGALSADLNDYTGAGWVEQRCSITVTAPLTRPSLVLTRSGSSSRTRRWGWCSRTRRRRRRCRRTTQFKSYKFTALKATAASVSLVGFEDAGFTFTLRGITVEVNSGSPLLLGLKPTIDWAGSFASTGGYLVETGDPDHPMLIDFRGTPLVGFAAEHVVLQVADNVFVSGAFSFRMGEVETVDVVKSGPDIAGLQVKTIKVGAQGVSIFLGDGLASYDIDDDIATYMSDQHPAMVVTGETVGNLVDGKIYRLVGSTLSAPNLTPGGGTGQNYSDKTVWRPVAATYLAGDSPGSVAVGETVGVWDATTVTYRVFERTTSVFTLAGALSADLNDYTGAGWVEQLVFHNGDGTLNADEIGADAVGFFLEDAAMGLVLANAQTAQTLSANNQFKSYKFTALKATAASVSLVGFEDAGFTFTLRGIIGRGQLRFAAAARVEADDRLGRLVRIDGRLSGRDGRPGSSDADRLPRHTADRRRSRARGAADLRQRIRLGCLQLPDR